MARPREPIALIQAKGRKHLTKAEIEQRKQSEIAPMNAGQITPPKFLSVTQKKRFTELAEQLQALRIMSETDSDALARYIVAEQLYEQAVRDLRAAHKEKPKKEDGLETLALWTKVICSLEGSQDRYFKQAQTAARDLGLTISSRCRLTVPQTAQEEPENKFSRFLPEEGGAEAV